MSGPGKVGGVVPPPPPTMVLSCQNEPWATPPLTCVVAAPVDPEQDRQAVLRPHGLGGEHVQVQAVLGPVRLGLRARWGPRGGVARRVPRGRRARGGEAPVADRRGREGDAEEGPGGAPVEAPDGAVCGLHLQRGVLGDGGERRVEGDAIYE